MPQEPPHSKCAAAALKRMKSQHCQPLAHRPYASCADAEIEAAIKGAKEAGASDAVLCTHHADGGAGATALGEAVMKACTEPNSFKFTYDLNLSLKVGSTVHQAACWSQPGEL